MKRLNIVLLTVILLLCECAYLLGTQAFSLAAAEPTAVPLPPVETPVTISVICTPTPTPLKPPPKTPKPDLPEYDYPSEYSRALSRGAWSVCPKRPTPNTKLAFMELVQNRVDDGSGDFMNTPPSVLGQADEFKDYDRKAYRSIENEKLADIAMRSWMFAELLGDRSYRLTPITGLYCDFYHLDGWDYIKIYNRAGDVVYDSGRKK